MEKTQNSSDYIAKALLIFGLCTIIPSLTDMAVALIPPHLSNPEWTNQATQMIADKALIPAIGVIFILLYVYKTKSISGETKGLLIQEQVTGILSILFALFLVISTILFSLSVGGVEKNSITNAKQASEKAKEQINQQYEAIKAKIPAEQIGELTKQKDAELVKISKNLEYFLSSSKTQSLKSKIRVLINYASFITVFGFAGVASMLSASAGLKKLRFKN